MPKLHHVMHARKAQPANGIEKGDSYYWWEFRNGGKHVSKTRPRRSQLTQSEFYAAMWEAEDSLTEAVSLTSDKDGILEALNSALDTVRDQMDSCADKVSNMESAFPNGSPTIDLVQQRADRCEEIVDELERLIGEIEALEEEDDPLCSECGHAQSDHEGPDEACSKAPCECPEFSAPDSELDSLKDEISDIDWSAE